MHETQRNPPADLAFISGATSIQLTKTFQLMKDVITKIIKDLGTQDMRHCYILYGSDAATKLSFTSDPVYPSYLVNFVKYMPLSKLPPSSSHVALEAASRAFRGRGVRPNSLKVLTVVTDVKGDSLEKETRRLIKC